MKAIVCAQYGPPEGLQLCEVETPVPKDDQVRIRIHATTVTAGDVILRRLSGLQRIVLGLFWGLRKNKILGHELAGEIESVGREVTRFKPGDQVFASAGDRGGAYAEYICLPQDGMVALKPANLSYAQAAAVPIGGNTALHILQKGQIQPGQRALIYGASGSVGSYAVQLARHFGAEVTAVCSTSNLGWVSSLGAARVLDYTQVDYAQSGETYDFVFDAVGKTTRSHAQRALKENGTYLSVKSPTRETPENLAFLKKLIEAGKLRAVVDRRYPLERIADAHRYVESGHKRGNVVITVAQDGRAPHAHAIGSDDRPSLIKSADVIEIEGIGPAYARRLEAAGIQTTLDLIVAGHTPHDRRQLAAQTGISSKRIDEWVQAADRLRMQGTSRRTSPR